MFEQQQQHASVAALADLAAARKRGRAGSSTSAYEMATILMSRISYQ